METLSREMSPTPQENSFNEVVSLSPGKGASSFSNVSLCNKFSSFANLLVFEQINLSSFLKYERDGNLRPKEFFQGVL